MIIDLTKYFRMKNYDYRALIKGIWAFIEEGTLGADQEGP
jgi:hypothetical protein